MRKIEIDQSGKIEQLSKDTVLCISDGDWDAILIKSQTKRQLQEIYRRNGQTRNFILFTFCAGLAILIIRNKKYPVITIDQEYLGKENVIKNILNEMFKKIKNPPDIIFDHIGKKANAHHIAHDIAVKEIEAKKILSLKEILKEIKKTEVGKRLKDA